MTTYAEINQIAQSIQEFYKADFRLRRFIVIRLCSIVTGPAVQHICSVNAGLELALCYLIGFGGFQEEHIANYLFDEYSLDHDNFVDDYKSISETAIIYNSEEDLSRKYSHFSPVEFEAYIQRIDFAEFYQEQNLLDIAKANYELEINRVEQVYGKENEIWWELTSALIDILKHQGQLAEATRLEREAFEVQKDMWGPRHTFAFRSMRRLRGLLVDQEEYEEAEELEAQILEITDGHLDKEGGVRLSLLSDLACRYLHEQRWKDAHIIDRRVTETRLKLLGMEHPLTLYSMDRLATSCCELGFLEEAEQLGKQVLETRQKILNDGHLNILESMNNLALTYSDQQKFGECQRQLEQMIKKAATTLDCEHPVLLAGLDNLAMLCWEQHCRDEALTMMRAVEGARTRSVGSLDKRTIGVRTKIQEWEEILTRERDPCSAEKELISKQAALDREKATLEDILSMFKNNSKELTFTHTLRVQHEYQ